MNADKRRFRTKKLSAFICVYLRLKWVLLALLIWLPLAASEHRGTVKFGGLPVPGVAVTATQGAQKLSAVSDADGDYSFADLPDGTWTIRVEMLCFEPIVREVAVAPGAPPALWELHLLPFDQIQASAPPPPKPAPAPAVATVASAPAAPSGKQPAPRKGAPAAAAAPQAGFQRTDLNAAAAPAAPATEPEAVTSAADTERAADGLLINGSSNNGAASPFAQSGAFGNNRRNGRSLYTGGVAMILDHSVLDARNFSLTGQDTPKLPYYHAQGTASFGGPLHIPHLIPPSQRPANFFIGYQWNHSRIASTNPGLMPTEAQRAGDFSQLPVRLVDPTSGLPFPTNVLPASRITPQATALLAFYPLPNFAQTARYNYQVPLVAVNNQDSLQARLNKTVGNRDQLFGALAWQRTTNRNPNIFDFIDNTTTSGLDVAPNWTHRFGQRVFSHFKYDYTRYSSQLTPNFADRDNVSFNAGITGNHQDPANYGPPNLTFSSGIAGLSDAQSAFTRNQTSTLSTDTFWNHRSHNITFGGDFKRQQMNLLGQQNARGSFTFTGEAAGNDFAGFLLGVPDTSSITLGTADRYFRSSIYDAYVQDDWRTGPGLTLNLGMRWEYWSPLTELYGRLVNLDITPGFAAETPVTASQPVGMLTGRNYPDSLLAPFKHGFEPRIGISWRPIAGSSMVVRAGYGINHNTSVYLPIATQMAYQSLTVPRTPADPITLANGFIPAPGVVPDSFAVDPGLRIGYVQTWQVSVQRDLPMAMVLTTTYLGIKGTRAQQMFLPNTYPAGAVNPCSTCQAGYAYMASNGNSTRESGQVQLRRRLHGGLGATLNYTWSKAIDDAALGGRGQSAALIAQNWLDLSAERGLSVFDQRHLMTLQLQYSTGMGGSALMSGARGLLFKGWTLLSNITAGTGLPLTPSYLVTVVGTGVTGPIRPEFTGAPLYAAPSGLSLNPAAYAPPPSGQWGNAGRSTITGPAQFTLNASLARTFRLNDRFNTDLRFDVTNALNHVTYTAWNTAITSTQFGLPVQANAMRSMQVTLRVRF